MAGIIVARNRAARLISPSLTTKLRTYSDASWDKRLQEPVQSYISTSSSPITNLSIEHYLLQKTSPESAVLFLYINKPSVIIGRNQNPWLEVNLALLAGQRNKEPHALGNVDLVRRRSGGGTVFHDEGNVNWTVISPSADFTRDKHAAMVVHALRDRGVARARVNERHDVVLDQGNRKSEVSHVDEYKSGYEVSTDGPRPLKISGSAYKLIRNRALHHGTCLLSSPNLATLPAFLKSPAKPYITARGVESVSSPVGNVMLDTEDFISAVQRAFSGMYANSSPLTPVEVGDEMKAMAAVQQGCDELESPEWTFLQTPQFEVKLPSSEAGRTLLNLSVKHGVITSAAWGQDTMATSAQSTALQRDLEGQNLHEVASWSDALSHTATTLDQQEWNDLHATLEEMLPSLSTRSRP